MISFTGHFALKTYIGEKIAQTLVLRIANKKMPNPTPHIESTKVDVGDRANPVITDITKGGKENSRIWHTKEKVIL